MIGALIVWARAVPPALARAGYGAPRAAGHRHFQHGARPFQERPGRSEVLKLEDQCQ